MQVNATGSLQQHSYFEYNTYYLKKKLTKKTDLRELAMLTEKFLNSDWWNSGTASDVRYARRTFRQKFCTVFVIQL